MSDRLDDATEADIKARAENECAAAHGLHGECTLIKDAVRLMREALRADRERRNPSNEDSYHVHGKDKSICATRKALDGGSE